MTDKRCIGCGAGEELRLGYCWNCAGAGEARAAKRTVLQHLGKAVRHIGNANFRYDVKWAWERLTRTGDYAPGGYFEKMEIDT